MVEKVLKLTVTAKDRQACEDRAFWKGETPEERDELIKNKNSTQRIKDKADVEELTS